MDGVTSLTKKNQIRTKERRERRSSPDDLNSWSGKMFNIFELDIQYKFRSPKHQLMARKNALNFILRAPYTRSDPWLPEAQIRHGCNLDLDLIFNAQSMSQLKFSSVFVINSYIPINWTLFQQKKNHVYGGDPKNILGNVSSISISISSCNITIFSRFIKYMLFVVQIYFYAKNLRKTAYKGVIHKLHHVPTRRDRVSRKRDDPYKNLKSSKKCDTEGRGGVWIW